MRDLKVSGDAFQSFFLGGYVPKMVCTSKYLDGSFRMNRYSSVASRKVSSCAALRGQPCDCQSRLSGCVCHRCDGKVTGTEEP